MTPVLYAIEAAVLRARRADDGRTESGSHEWQEDLRRAVDAIAGLTAVDGATLMSDRYELIAFGAKITRRRGNPPVERVDVTEPVEGSVADLACTRRSSAAPATCRRRSSSTTSATRSRWSRRRTAASRSSSGRRARTWCTRTAWKRCCSKARHCPGCLRCPGCQGCQGVGAGGRVDATRVALRKSGELTWRFMSRANAFCSKQPLVA